MALTPLLPERHPTRDFFIADIFDNMPVKDDMASMESPFFTLSTRPDHRHLKFEHGNKSVSIIPSGLGLPTIFDKDILLYCASQVMEQLNRGESPPKTLRMSVHDCLIATNRNTSGDAYERFKSSLDRLRGCTIKTSIKTGRVAQVEGFGLIDSYRYIESGRVKDRLVGLEITLSDWFYNSLIAKEVLTINRDYFRLRKPVERRVYEIARKHCGHKTEWKISLQRLYAKSGALSDVKHFRAAMKRMSEHDHLPDYHLSYSRDEDAVNFFSRLPTEKRADKEQLTLFETTSGDLISLPTEIPADLAEDARRVARNQDIYALWAEWLSWNKQNAARLDNWRGAFIGFCRKRSR